MFRGLSAWRLVGVLPLRVVCPAGPVAPQSWWFVLLGMWAALPAFALRLSGWGFDLNFWPVGFGLGFVTCHRAHRGFSFVVLRPYRVATILSGLAWLLGLPCVPRGFGRGAVGCCQSGGVVISALCGSVALRAFLGVGQMSPINAQQAGQRDAPPVGGFGVWFFIRVWGFAWLPLAARPLP